LDVVADEAAEAADATPHDDRASAATTLAYMASHVGGHKVTPQTDVRVHGTRPLLSYKWP
jgi:hypothetical protein